MSARRDLIDIESLDDGVLRWLLSRAVTIREYAGKDLADVTVVNLFYEASTRTRVSFEMAAKRLRANVVNVAAAHASVVKGETLLDTARTVYALGARVIVLRHPDAGAAGELAAAMPPDLAVINAGDGIRSHPSQALLDALTLRQSGLDLETASIAIIGDIRHSRVARSDMELFRRLGVRDLRLAGPAHLMPERAPAGVTLHDTLAAAIDGADAVIMLRVQAERMDPAGRPDPAGYFRTWGLQPGHLAGRPHCRVLHPGPMNRGVEIDTAVADGAQSLIWRQVENGLAVRMAIFEWAVHGMGAG